MSHTATHVSQAICAALSHAMWMVLGGFAVIAAAFYGGPIIVAAWQDATKARAQRQARETALRRDAAEGIVEIQAFLAQQTPAPGHTKTEDDGDERHRFPPIWGEAV